MWSIGKKSHEIGYNHRSIGICFHSGLQLTTNDTVYHRKNCSSSTLTYFLFRASYYINADINAEEKPPAHKAGFLIDNFTTTLYKLFHLLRLKDEPVMTAFSQTCYEIFKSPKYLLQGIIKNFESLGEKLTYTEIRKYITPEFSDLPKNKQILKYKIKALEQGRAPETNAPDNKRKALTIIKLYFNILIYLEKFEDLIEFELLLQEYLSKSKGSDDQAAVENRKAIRDYIQKKRREKEEERQRKDAATKEREALRAARMLQYNRTYVKTNPEDHIARAEAEEKSRQETREFKAQIAEENARLDRQAAEDQKRAEERARREARFKMDEEEAETEAATARIETGNPEAHAVYNKIWNGGRITLDELKILLIELGADYRPGKGSHVVIQIHNIAFKDTEGNLQDELFVEPLSSEIQQEESESSDEDTTSGGGGGGSSAYSAKEVLPLPGNPKGKYLHSYLIRQLKEKFTRMGWDADTLVLKG